MIEFLTKVSRGSRNLAGELQNDTEHSHGRRFGSGVVYENKGDGER